MPSDDQLRLRIDLLESAMDADLADGRRPLLVSANGGATNSGAVDPLAELADLCAERKVWLHVDAAYGGFAVLDRARPRAARRDRARRLDHARSPQVAVPTVRVRLPARARRAQLRRAFLITPDYLREAAALDREVNFSDLGLQLTRMARAFKVWVSVQYFGLDAFRKAIDRTFDLAERARQRIEASDRLELAARPALGIVSFRRTFDENEDLLNARLVAALEESGLGLVSSTRLKGRYTIRMCVMSHTSGAEDVDRVLDFLEQTDVADVDSGSARYERHPDVTLSGVRRRDGGGQARFALLESLPSDDAAHVVALGEPRRIAPGRP